MIFRHPKGTPGALNCIQVRRVVQRHLDGELDDRTSELLRLHLDECRRCGLAADHYRHIKNALSGIGDDREAIERLRRFAGDLASTPSD